MATAVTESVSGKVVNPARTDKDMATMRHGAMHTGVNDKTKKEHLHVEGHRASAQVDTWVKGLAVQSVHLLVHHRWLGESNWSPVGGWTVAGKSLQRADFVEKVMDTPGMDNGFVNRPMNVEERGTLMVVRDNWSKKRWGTDMG